MQRRDIWQFWIITKEKKLMVLEDFTLEAPKTRKVAEMMNSLKFENTKVLFVTKENDRNLVLAARNIPYTNVQKAPDFSVYDILNANFVSKNEVS